MGRQNSMGIHYTVRSGDTLYSISQRYNATIAEISRENQTMDIYSLHPGDEILIPFTIQSKARVIEYKVKGNDTIQTILNRYHIELEELLNYNDLESLKLRQGMLLHIPTHEMDVNEIV